MAAAVESSALSTQGTNSTSITATEPSGAAEGDLLVAIHVADSTATVVTPPSGWIGEALVGNGAGTRISRIVRGSSAPSLTFTSDSSQEHVVIIFRISGYDPHEPLTPYNFGSGGGGTIPNTPPTAAFTNGALVFSGFGADGDTEPDAVPTGYTGLFSQSSVGGGTCTAGLAYKAMTSADLEDPGDWGTTTINGHATHTFVINGDPGDPSNAGSPVVESWSSARIGNNAAITVDKPLGTVEGDLLLLLHVCDNVETITPPSGFTDIIDESFGSNCTMHVSRKFAGASEPTTYTSSSGSSESRVAMMLRISNVDADTPVDVSGFTTGTGTPSCPTVTTTVPDAFVFRVYAGAERDGAYPGFITDDTGFRNMISSAVGTGACCGGIGVALQASVGATGAKTWGSNSINSITATVVIAPVEAPADEDSLLTTMVGMSY